MQHFTGVAGLFMAVLGISLGGCAGSAPHGQQAQLRETVTKLAGFGTRHTLSEGVSTTRPGSGIVPARQWLASEMRTAAAGAPEGVFTVVEQLVEVKEPTARIPKAMTMVNVLGILEGSDPPESRKVIVVSGHYDSRAADVMDPAVDSPGANDDGSGTAVVLELARTLGRGPRLRHTVVFALVAGEEQGLNGSAGLAEYAKAQHWPVIAMITNDIVGNSRGGNGVVDRKHIRVFSEGVPTVESAMAVQQRQNYGGENDGASRQLARYVAAVSREGSGTVQAKLVYRRDRFGRGGDHIPFLRQGYAAVRLTEMNEDLSRQHADVVMKNGKPYGDLPEYMDYEYLAKVYELNRRVVESLASAPPAPAAVWIDPAPGDGVKLSWETSPGASEYVVLVRDSSSADWEHATSVMNGTDVTLKDVSKDDCQVAVQAVGKAGSRSLPIVPVARVATSRPATRR